MTDRAAKRLRRLSTEYDDSEDGTANSSHHSSVPTPAPSTRPRRGTANQTSAAAVIQRSSPDERRQSIHLTVKSSPGKLRQATGAPPVAKASVSRQNIVSGKRASRNSRVVREADSDDDDDDDDEADEADAMDLDDDEEDDEEEGDVDAEGDEDDDMDAEGDEDDDMDDDVGSNIIVNTRQNIPVKPALKLDKPQDAVEAKEMALDDDDDDDDELSDPDSDLEGEEEDAEGEDEDAEGDDDDEMAAGNDDEEAEVDSDEDMSRDQTPDLSKLTRRQRALVNEDSDGALMALSNEAQKKKHFTAEENAMRRAEMARRRKNLSEKRLEEEKADTINRLLKKQPPKRGRKSMGITESGQDEDEAERANPLFIRYVQNAKGTQLGVPEEWLQAPVGSLFSGSSAPPSTKPFSGRMVEEVA